MPMYLWITELDNGTEMEVEVLREFDKYEDPPTEEELKGIFSGDELKMALRKDRVWRRKIGKPQISRARGWGKKGHW